MNRIFSLAGSMLMILMSGGLVQSCGETPEAEVSNGSASVSGIFKFEGDIPESDPATFKVTKDAAHCGASKPNEMFVVSEETGGLANVVISFPLIAGDDSPAAAVNLRQKDCIYEPHVQAVRAGADINIFNDDPIFHNIHAYGANDETLFNIAHLVELGPVKKQLWNPGIVEVRCDVHDWMKAFVSVQANRYFAVTDSRGHYTIDGVPAGIHIIQAWHETFPEPIQKEITVTAGQPVTEDFVIAME